MQLILREKALTFDDSSSAKRKLGLVAPFDTGAQQGEAKMPWAWPNVNPEGHVLVIVKLESHGARKAGCWPTGLLGIGHLPVCESAPSSCGQVAGHKKNFLHGQVSARSSPTC